MTDAAPRVTAAPATRRGSLRVYLGAAPGVGKTFDMLSEGRRAKERGTDVVVGFVETHGRVHTAEQIGELEVVPRRTIEYRGSTFEEMDVDAILARHPERALVDELAHTNVPGSRNEKRWQDVEELLASGIDVISSSLCQDEVTWSEDEAADFHRTISEETDRLTALVYNLLDMSRIQAGALQPSLGPIALEEVVPSAIASLGPRRGDIDVDVPETLPPVVADAALLERAVANLIADAVRFSPDGEPVRVQAGMFGGHIDLRVIDRGPGIPRHQREQVFHAFQRLGDNQPGTGVGLGLAVARGFLTAVGASVELDDTPGGGTTAIVCLRIAE